MKRPSRKRKSSRLLTLIKDTEPRELLQILRRICDGTPRKFTQANEIFVGDSDHEKDDRIL